MVISTYARTACRPRTLPAAVALTVVLKPRKHCDDSTVDRGSTRDAGHAPEAVCIPEYQSISTNVHALYRTPPCGSTRCETATHAAKTRGSFTHVLQILGREPRLSSRREPLLLCSGKQTLLPSGEAVARGSHDVRALRKHALPRVDRLARAHAERGRFGQQPVFPACRNARLVERGQ